MAQRISAGLPQNNAQRQQEDAHEFFNWLVDSTHEELLRLRAASHSSLGSHGEPHIFFSLSSFLTLFFAHVSPSLSCNGWLIVDPTRSSSCDAPMGYVCGSIPSPICLFAASHGHGQSNSLPPQTARMTCTKNYIKNVIGQRQSWC